MKAVLVMGGFAFGGAERVMCSLANHIVQANDVTIITLSNKEETYALSPKVKIINGIGWKNYVDGVFKLRSTIKREQPDIVVSFLVQVNIAACMALLGTSIPLIISERNDPAHMPPEMSRRILRKLFYRFSDGYVFQTEEAKEYFGKRISKHATVIPNPLELSVEPSDISTRPKRMMAVARITPQKNYMLMLKAFIKSNAVRNGWKLDIFGDGDESEIQRIRAFISENGLNESVFINKASTRIHDEMNHHAVFLLSSDFEGMPNALMEAMGMGLACISTDCPCGGPAFLIQNEKNGLLTRVDDSDDMASAINRVIENDSFRIGIAAKAVDVRNSLHPNMVFSQWDKYIARFL